jgi:hypothetical protein
MRNIPMSDDEGDHVRPKLDCHRRTRGRVERDIDRRANTCGILTKMLAGMID